MKFETRDIQSRIKTMKIRRKNRIRKKSKSENDYTLLTYPPRCHIKKIPLFDEKSFSDKFIFNLFDAYQKSNTT